MFTPSLRYNSNQGKKMKMLFKLFIIFISLVSLSASADCQFDFMNKFEVMDSKAFSMHDNDLEGDFYESSEEYVREVVINLVSEVKSCQKEKAVFISDVNCMELIPGKPFSKNCVVESRIGYFFISLDMLDNINIIFNRWD